jgi:hypothetical protein
LISRDPQRSGGRLVDERLSKVPADLDTKPYRDEHDFDLLRRMMAAVEKGHLRSNRGKGAVRKAVQKVMHHVEHRGKSAPPANKRVRGRVAAK